MKKTMKKTVCFGEIMARMCPPDGIRIGQSSVLEMTFGGAESNVAASLACLGLPSSYVTKLPDNPLTDACIAQLRALNVDTSSIAIGGERMGIYFVEKAISFRPSRVVYDRKHSSIACIRPGDIDWDSAFEGANWFHWSGITPALSPEAAQEQLAACRIAKARGLTVSCDLNYRPALWSGEEASRVMTPLMEYTDVVIANESEPGIVFDLHADKKYYEDGALSSEGYAVLAKAICDRFDIKKCGFAIREGTQKGLYIWSGLVYDCASGKYEVSSKYNLQIMDRIGGGDAFSAGLIAAMQYGQNDKDAVCFAAAASALKHTFQGDINRATKAEVDALLGRK